MSSQTPLSILSYFPRTTKSMQKSSQDTCPAVQSRMQEPPEPLRVSSAFNPRNDYQEMDIGNMTTGLGCVTVTGRIANYFKMPNSSKLEAAAKGAFKLVVKDDTGAFTVKLWYADTIYELTLGLLVSVWTPHVHTQHQPQSSILDLTTSIFPERDNTCHFLVYQDQGSIISRTPLGHRNGKDLTGLMTLKRFVEGGQQSPGARVLVCVKNISGRKKVTPKNKEKETFETADVAVFDDTEEIVLSLVGSAISSSTSWQPSETVLLITDANLKQRKGQVSFLGLKTETLVDVDPLMKDAYWLRDYAQRIKKRECVNQPFPIDVFDVEAAEGSEERIFFTLADIDEWARANPSQQFLGWLNLTVIEMNLVSLYKRNMLLCEECCGLPTYANATEATCRNCERVIPLRLNPKLMGMLIDETGGIMAGKAIWSEDAWWQLLGRTADELVASSMDVIQYLEHRILFLTITVMFGWSCDVGKIVILKTTTL